MLARTDQRGKLNQCFFNAVPLRSFIFLFLYLRSFIALTFERFVKSFNWWY